MRRFFIVIAVLALAGCATGKRQVGPAEITSQNGEQWVHVLGTGVKFPLLGKWNDVRPGLDKDKAGKIQTIFATQAPDESFAAFCVGTFPVEGMTLMELLMERWYTFEGFGNYYCKSENSEVEETTMHGERVLYVRCHPFSGLQVRRSVCVAKDTKDGPLCFLGYIAWGDAHKIYGEDAEAMLGRIEINP